MNDPIGLIGNSAINRSQFQPRVEQAAGDGADFKKVLMENIEQVNRLQQDAEKALEDLTGGRRDDLANVMIAKQKADTAFKMLLQVRNKLMEAYDEVKQMRV